MVSLGNSCEVFGILGKSLKKTKMNKAVNISVDVTAMRQAFCYFHSLTL